MHEIELKFQVPARRRAAVARAVAGEPLHLQAAYVDTPDRALAAAGLALRVRREGSAWVQTLKGEAGDGMTRLEHNVRLPARGQAVPPIDPARHAGTPVGQLLDAALEAAPADAAVLAVLYRTDIHRHRRVLDTPQGQVELAFDVGVIEAAGQRVPVCELEIELVGGSPLAVLETARAWVARHGLWLDTRSKAERGDRLSRDDAPATPPPAPLAPAGDARVDASGRAVLQACARQICAAASELAAGSEDPEALHALRVALRRLRSLHRLLHGGHAPPAWWAGALQLFQALGAVRDEDAMRASVLPSLQRAMESAGVTFDLRLGASTPGRAALAERLRSQPTQALLLDLLQAAQPVPQAPAQGSSPDAPSPDTPKDAPQDAGRSLHKRLARQLQRWHRQVRADIAQAETLTDAQRHRLRKRIKRLRYATEWAAPRYPKRRVRHYLLALREAQACLGEITDLAVAAQRWAAAAEDAGAMFALGWLTARREALLAVAPARLAALAEARPYWR